MPKGRQHTADQKLKILEKARKPDTTVAEVLRRHQLDATTFYRWERQAKSALREAFSERRRSADAKDREIERLPAELARKRRVIAEVVEENLKLKKSLSLGSRTRRHPQRHCGESGIGVDCQGRAIPSQRHPEIRSDCNARPNSPSPPSQLG